jgi:hypothetical protein
LAFSFGLTLPEIGGSISRWPATRFLGFAFVATLGAFASSGRETTLQNVHEIKDVLLRRDGSRLGHRQRRTLSFSSYMRAAR